MNLFKTLFFIFLCQFKVSSILFEPDKLLLNVINAIHTKNLPVLTTLLTPEADNVIRDKLGRTPAKTIPVLTFGKVMSIDARNLSEVTFIARVGNLTSTYIAVARFGRYLLDLQGFDRLVDEQKLRENIRNMRKDEDALKLLEDIRSAIESKNSKSFQILVSPNASFMRCQNSSVYSKNIWDKIQKLPIQQIPVVQKLLVTKTVLWRNRMTFYTKIDGRDVTYRATYDSFRWVLDKENCSKDYPALVDHKSLGEKIAVNMYQRFTKSLLLLSPRRYRDVVARRLTLSRCDGSQEIHKAYSFFYHYLDHKQFYVFDYNRIYFNVTDVVFNATYVTFIASYRSIRNQITVERRDEEYRISAIQNLKCLDYSDPYFSSFQHADYLYAEKLIARFVTAHQTKNRKLLMSVVTDPYILTNGSFLTHQMIQETLIFPEDFRDLYVFYAEYAFWGLTMFRAKTPGDGFGFEFTVYTGLLADRQLLSEQIVQDPTYS